MRKLTPRRLEDALNELIDAGVLVRITGEAVGGPIESLIGQRAAGYAHVEPDPDRNGIGVRGMLIVMDWKKMEAIRTGTAPAK